MLVRWLRWGVVVAVSAVSAVAARTAVASEHPGNVFVAGEEVRVGVPAGWAGWRAVDWEGNEIARGTGGGGGGGGGGVAALGKLPVGFYELREAAGAGKVTAGVVAKSSAVADTPIALDAAVSWFYADPEQIRDACRLCRLAGVAWVRDRASWPELEPARGTWAAGETRYERAMRIEHEMGLKVLQVNHIAPPWAGADAKRFPEDLRDVYAFYRGLAERWKGLADAIEPWNEPDIVEFGGQTGCEIASFQKAAYLGLKAGNPDFAVNDTVFAIDRAETLEEFAANEAWPYFDRYDLHHYVRLPAYPRAYGRHRAASGGRPMWTTEFNLPVIWADEKTKEPSDEELHFQTYRVGKVFARALHEGAVKAFYFILGDYVERNIQYGLVHRDMTPRPAFVAFAAVGRLLNGAVPLGRVGLGDEKLFGYAFRTQVDGAAAETMVTWSETKPVAVAVPAGARVFDVLGRERPAAAGKVELTRSTVYVVLPPGGTKGMNVEAPPAKPSWAAGSPSPVVLQLIGATDFKRSAFRLDGGGTLRLVAYNFGEGAVRGALVVEGATGAPAVLEVPAGGRTEVVVKPVGPGRIGARFHADEGGDAVVSARAVAAVPATTQVK